MDYFSAAATILFGLYLTVIRNFHLYHPSRTTMRRTWSTLCFVALAGHITYLSIRPRFDYTYNIISNSVVGLTHNIIWTLYSLPSSLSVFKRYPHRPRSYRPGHATNAAPLVIFTTAATLLEVFDFAPIAGTIDAHSLWHLSTALIAPFWYQFLLDDSRDRGWTLEKAE